MRLGCATRGRGEADALFEVRQEALHAKGIRSEEAARLHVARDVNYFQPSVLELKSIKSELVVK